MSLTLPSVKGSPLTCEEYEANILFSLDLANATGFLDCSKINQLSLATCLLANSVIIQLQQDISDNATAIGEVAQDLTDSQTTLQTSINNLVTLINNQNATIADLTTQVTTLTSGFNSLSGTVESFNSRLLSVEGRLTTIEGAIAFAIASGIIVVWRGLLTAIPTGWVFCDGTNGTPDLRNRFIIAAGSTYAVDAIGGSVSHTHNISGNTSSTVLTVGQMPYHTHGINDPGHTHIINDPGHTHIINDPGHAHTFFPVDTVPANDGIDALVKTNSFGSIPINSTTSSFTGITIQSNGTNTSILANGTNTSILANGNNEGHSHTFSATTATTSNLPPYYALAYIMRI